MKRLLIVLWLGLLAGLVFAATPAIAEEGDEPPAVQPGDDPAPARFSYNGPVGGTLDETDKVFLQKVRQAGMWERPMGQEATRKGKSARTREIGKLIDFDHANLDADVTAIAGRLTVSLPTKPTPEQQMWMDEINGKTGQAFDDAFATLLRSAHGSVFQLIAAIRANSRNDLVRAFAAHANNVVHRHMVLLESTTNVNYAHIPKAKASTGRTRPYQQEPLFVVALVAIAGAVGFTGVMRALRT